MAFYFLFNRDRKGDSGNSGCDLILMIVAIIIIFAILQCTGRMHVVG